MACVGVVFVSLVFFSCRPIYPCRSLCSKVRAGCETRMGAYGFPWPAMLDCAKFPEDNDMCITAQAEAKSSQTTGSFSFLQVALVNSSAYPPEDNPTSTPHQENYDDF